MLCQWALAFLRSENSYNKCLIYIVQDSNVKDEKMILADMEKLITYRHMCLNYIVGKHYSKQLKKVAGYFRMSGGNIEPVLEKATEYYSV